MTRAAVVLDGAKADFSEIKKYVKRQFGDLVWAEVNQEFKDTIKRIAANPLLGTHVEQLAGLGYDNFRKTLVRQTRVVYEFDSQQLIVHMFIHTKRDFKTHLEKRLLAP
ncbi:MAG: type II toxin-antitoxin system RelE/ParE family toxin [Rhodoferax sp.]|uniref:type II toxin-antitoxin system RelE/ParE family toxin n=1 Tax=Rhodoferax sp. TaxID=50421 RepID=UPI00262735E9|nr:type II toxin-antitoxin system RelE/ParE family toxin [Rhodoferax sp.]MDD2881485.1 type II toxin-antitoxin system RelE/ParE family toxin [Rhodoferax sp.]